MSCLCPWVVATRKTRPERPTNTKPADPQADHGPRMWIMTCPSRWQLKNAALGRVSFFHIPPTLANIWVYLPRVGVLSLLGNMKKKKKLLPHSLCRVFNKLIHGFWQFPLVTSHETQIPLARKSLVPCGRTTVLTSPSVELNLTACKSCLLTAKTFNGGFILFTFSYFS